MADEMAVRWVAAKVANWAALKAVYLVASKDVS